MEGLLSQVSVMILLICWPTTTHCEENTTADPFEWLKKEDIPRYYVIVLGGLLLVTIIGCITCYFCSWRRKRKEFFTDESKESPRKYSSWEMVASLTNLAENDDEKNLKDTKKQDQESLTIKVKVQSINNKEEVESNEGALKEDAEDAGNNEFDAKCSIDKPLVEGKNNYELSGDIAIPDDSKQEILIEAGSESVAYEVLDNGSKPRAEPVYAEVNKPTKKNVTSGYSIVYAELADFDGKKSINSQRATPQPTAEYAEIARLTKSPRDMCPLDE